MAAGRQLTCFTLNPACDQATDLAWDGRYLWITDTLTGFFYQYDQDGTYIRGIDIYTEFDLIGDYITWNGKYVCSYDSWYMEVFLFDPGDLTAIRTVPIPTVQPSGLAWDGKHFWQYDGSDGTLNGISPTTGTIEHKVAVSSPGTGMTYDGKHLWVCNGGLGTINQINPFTGSIVSSIPALGVGTLGVTWDGRTLYNSRNTQICQLSVN